MINKHIHYLIQEGAEHGQMHSVWAARTVAGEALEMLKAIQQAAGSSNTTDARLRRKRNILGDIISSITGLATIDTVHKQEQHDRDLRSRIESIMNLQKQEANDIGSILGNITQEEEALQEQITNLGHRHTKDVRHMHKHNLRLMLVQADISTMRDILMSMQDGIATVRQTARFMTRTSTDSIPHFTYKSIHLEHGTLHIAYQAKIMHNVEVSSVQSHQQGWQVRTSTRMYLLNSKPKEGDIVSAAETVLMGGNCSGCALIVNIGHGMHRVMESGNYSCAGDEAATEVKEGEIIMLSGETQCGNLIMSVYGVVGTVKNFHIRMGEDTKTEEAILARVLSEGGKIEDRVSEKSRHQAMQTTLHHDMVKTKEQMEELGEWARKEESEQWEEEGVAGVAVAWTICTTALVMMLLWLFWRCYFSTCCCKRGSKEDSMVNTAATIA